MRSKTRALCSGFFLSFLFAASPFSLCAQQADPATPTVDALPDAPAPQVETATVQPASAEEAAAQTQTPSSAPGQTDAGQPGSSSSASSPAAPSDAGSQETQKQKAADQIKEEEQQRVLGIVPAFNTTYHNDAAALTAGQKIDLAFRSSVDPFTFAAAFLVAGYHEALDEDSGFGWGAEGYFKRSGAAYLDAVNGTMIGNGFLPALLHQDPRYFRLGHGTVTHRMLYALATNVICKGDKTRHWQPNISNVGGNIIAGAISNLYYPPQNSGWGQTIYNGMIVTAEGGIGSLFQEFWPDLSRKFLHKDPTHGLDAQMRAQDAQQKSAQQSQGPIQK